MENLLTEVYSGTRTALLICVWLAALLIITNCWLGMSYDLLIKVYYDPRGKRTVPSGPNCVCRGGSGANFDPELFVSGPQPVARGVARDSARTVLYILLENCTK